MLSKQIKSWHQQRGKTWIPSTETVEGLVLSLTFLPYQQALSRNRQGPSLDHATGRTAFFRCPRTTGMTPRSDHIRRAYGGWFVQFYIKKVTLPLFLCLANTWSMWLSCCQVNPDSLPEGSSSVFPQHLGLVLGDHSSPLFIYPSVFHSLLRFPWGKRLGPLSVSSNIPGTWHTKKNSFSLQPKTSFPRVKAPSPPVHTGAKHFWDYKKLQEFSWDTERTVVEDTMIFQNKLEHFIPLLWLPISLPGKAEAQNALSPCTCLGQLLLPAWLCLSHSSVKLLLSIQVHIQQQTPSMSLALLDSSPSHLLHLAQYIFVYTLACLLPNSPL